MRIPAKLIQRPPAYGKHSVHRRGKQGGALISRAGCEHVISPSSNPSRAKKFGATKSEDTPSACIGCRESAD
ncbi:MAG: hypothetical protein C4532_06055 [Candidatus Abyssobacteria bacterium SURF_17]|uniref:Uncharacterized protein n=1 Tax=Candidatus Abyssobacteria bacterium SURF_17 TaxID=2093361 RepID=A0A419F276_9BACT|nr:MAG: hypothetical protein C4532_06055 [Candidatus Abyssubacteria bacterium SURF_17]